MHILKYRNNNCPTHANLFFIPVFAKQSYPLYHLIVKTLD